MKSSLPRLFILFFGALLAACRIQMAPPELLRATPDSVFVGQSIALSGNQFGSQPSVTFSTSKDGSTSAGRVVNATDNTIQVTVPLIAPGQTTVRVSNSQGTSDPLPVTILQPAPTLTTIDPANGLPNSVIVLTGAYLNQINTVRFNQLSAVIQDSTDTKLTLRVPSGIPRGQTFIVVETKGGSFTVPFIVAGTPQITSLSTRQARPGTELIVQGVNLSDGVVSINGLATNRDQTTIQDNQIKTIIPDNATSGKVTVTVFEKLVATSADSLKIIRPPAITSVSTLDGIAGDRIQLAGVNLGDVTALTFNSVPAPFRVLSSSLLETTLPALGQAGNYTLGVSSVGGTAQFSQPFVYYVAPSNLSLSPARIVNNANLSITGNSVYRITDVRIGTQTVPIIGRTEGSSVQVSIPTGIAGGLVTVVNRAGQATTSSPLVIVQRPTVTDIIPQKARPGERIVVRGTYLQNAQFYFFNSSTPAAEGGRNEDNEHWILVPTDAQSGSIRVTNATGEGAQTDVFTVIRPVTVTDFTPKSTKIGGELIVSGQNLASTTAVRVNGGTLNAPFRISGTSLIITIPTGTVTGQICVINDAGTTCSSANFTPAN
ncbi:cell shape determination protein CcmA [Spirosoma rhododendri]|uniref:Cell shape determination protein CcmA n=1 Tax=Spirosoma rhododendri TaxID=2728024 RepID=A0A7L5DYC0_9BACT|nr:cell shape determination protein CcmA [Spirosoma rhododendri]QJD80977.1 cell shape determination protein CcmA [Spirosoma rhododendri]